MSKLRSIALLVEGTTVAESAMTLADCANLVT